ncbi:hypothetical protein [Methanobrevibacter sp.]|uniref:hypothetical protein n=1 Tax=Methanobrevibacter sp. TaxID=66852 RepID=UPI0025FCA247|nr:hypothetical protein [Methanobrevibacter sp.]MBQ2831589.1 hypothetical protein [Methanobrevibacter sp.]
MRIRIKKGCDIMNHDHNSINWSEKVKSLDNTIREEIGMEGESEAKHILIKVQTKSSEPIEPAFIVGEDDTFLDLFVLSPQGPGITSTAVLKSNIQSVGVIGGVSAEKVDASEVNEAPLLDDVGGLYQ